MSHKKVESPLHVVQCSWLIKLDSVILFLCSHQTLPGFFIQLHRYLAKALLFLFLIFFSNFKWRPVLYISTVVMNSFFDRPINNFLNFFGVLLKCQTWQEVNTKERKACGFEKAPKDICCVFVGWIINLWCTLLKSFSIYH